MGAFNFVFRNIYQTRKKRLTMADLILFIIGFLIFTAYIFFLTRMVWRQHNIQKKSDPVILNSEEKVKKEDPSSN
jgi:large-conductance mechanosensitive channel